MKLKSLCLVKTCPCTEVVVLSLPFRDVINFIGNRHLGLKEKNVKCKLHGEVSQQEEINFRGDLEA